MKKSTIWTLLGLLFCALMCATCVHDCAYAPQPLWHTGVCLFIFMPAIALCFDKSERASRRSAKRKHSDSIPMCETMRPAA